MHGIPCHHRPGHFGHDDHLQNHPIDVPDGSGGRGNGWGMVCGEGPGPFMNPRNVQEQHIQNVPHKVAGTDVPTTNKPLGPRLDGLLTTRIGLDGWIGRDRVDGVGPRSDIARNPDGFPISSDRCTCTRPQ